MGTDLKQIKAEGVASVVITSLGVICPLGLGFLVAWGCLNQFGSLTTLQVYENIYYGVILTATSVSITVATLKELGRLKSKVGTALVAAAILDDIIGVVLLSVVIALSGVKNSSASGFDISLATVFHTDNEAANIAILLLVMYLVFIVLSSNWTSNGASFQEVSHDISDGNIANSLTRPVSYRGQKFALTLGNCLGNFLIFSVQLFIIAMLIFSLGLGQPWPQWYNILFYLVAGCSAIVITDSIDFMEAINNRPTQDFKIEFKTSADFERFKGEGYRLVREQPQYQQVTINIDREDIAKLFTSLAHYDVHFISEVRYTLAKHFQDVLKEKTHAP